jgi:endonuclease/exonuclease/phosphatase family metal-dependent hydrolase
MRTLLFAALVLVTSQAHSIAPTLTSTTTTNGSTEISVMAYNVANLFDTVHDEGKDDWAYLPLSMKTDAVKAECNKIPVWPWRMECLHLDWTPEVLAQKIDRVAHAILSVNNGRGPDVLMLEEVENIGVLNQLNAALGAARYTSVVLIEGNDDRGIDQAMLSRLPLSGSPVNDPIPLSANAKARKEPGKTRGLLQSTFQLPGGELLTVFGVHFPSGEAAHDQRTQAVEFLNSKRAQLPASRLVVVGGDFNINAAEDKTFNVYSNDLSPWMISHLIGCKGCVGTEFYKTKNEWSFLDALGFSKNLAWDQNASWSVDETSISIPVNDPQMAKPDGSPQVFDAKTGLGVSDHFPIFAVLRKR